MIERWYSDYKQCNRCKQYLPVSKFYKNQHRCKDCCKEHYKQNKDKILEYHREWAQRNRDKIREYHREYFAKQRGLGYFLLFNNFLPSDIKVNYHHINDMIVVPIPRKTHSRFNSNQFVTHQHHIDKCNEWIRKYYCIDVEKLLSA